MVESPFDVLERQLIAAANRQTLPVPDRPVQSSKRRWWKPSRRVGLLAAGVALVAGTAMAATGTAPWEPVLGSPERGGRPVAANAGVPQEQLNALSILRRPQTAADRSPIVRSALRVLSGETINGIHTDGIRVIFRTSREVAILVPAERVGPTDIPDAAQQDVLCLMASSYHTARTVTITQHNQPKKLHFPAGFDGWGMHCGDTEMLRSSGIQTGTSPDPTGGVISNGRPSHPLLRRITLVPDGVARVTVRLRHGRWVTVPVHDNVYRYTTRESPAFMGTIWFDADGNRIDHRRRR